MATAHKRILIVEDEKPLAHALELKLTHEGYETVLAHDGQTGINLINSEKFDVVLLDLMMPVMDGFQVLKQLKDTEHPPAVFVLSNLSLHDDESQAIKLGARKYFVKSNTPLATIVEEIKKV